MPSPCNQSEERVVFDPDTKTVNLGVAFCPFLNKPCKPKGCPFANGRAHLLPDATEKAAPVPPHGEARRCRSREPNRRHNHAACVRDEIYHERAPGDGERYFSIRP